MTLPRRLHKSHCSARMAKAFWLSGFLLLGSVFLLAFSDDVQASEELLPQEESFCNERLVELRFKKLSYDTKDLSHNWKKARFNVEVVDTEPKRNRGLMFREHMALSSGMLFVYDRPQQVFFWMKNTLLPLDIIFADQSGRITKIHHRAQPHDETTIDGGQGVQYVLEINAGLAKRLGITEGGDMRHPLIQNPAWPCGEH